MHLIQHCIREDQTSPLIEALMNVWEYGKGPSFDVAYKGRRFSASRGSISAWAKGWDEEGD